MLGIGCCKTGEKVKKRYLPTEPRDVSLAALNMAPLAIFSLRKVQWHKDREINRNRQYLIDQDEKKKKNSLINNVTEIGIKDLLIWCKAVRLGAFI